MSKTYRECSGVEFNTGGVQFSAPIKSKGRGLTLRLSRYRVHVTRHAIYLESARSGQGWKMNWGELVEAIKLQGTKYE